MPRTRRRRRQYNSVHECMEDLLSREDLGNLNRLGLWSVFSTVEEVKRFAAQSRAERNAFFARYSAQLEHDAPPCAPDADHRLFDLPQKATVEQIRARYRELAKAFHPDRAGDHELMLQINTTYQRLLEQARLDADKRTL